MFSKQFVSPVTANLAKVLVGPNLTDDYWLHGGSINDVFKTIKYGWPEKGMKSWKDDYSPFQIAQIASYIKSLHGTNPPNPKGTAGNDILRTIQQQQLSTKRFSKNRYRQQRC